MENSKFVKIVLIILTGVMLVAMGMCGSNTVAAADSNGTNYSDLGAVLNGTNNTTTNNTTNSAANNTINNTTNNTSTNTLNTSALTNTINTATTNNTTTLPKTGIANSTPVVALIAIFGISAIYAYKKIRDYKSL